jgi:hypothetical protein
MSFLHVSRVVDASRRYRFHQSRFLEVSTLQLSSIANDRNTSFACAKLAKAEEEHRKLFTRKSDIFPDKYGLKPVHEIFGPL